MKKLFFATLLTVILAFSTLANAALIDNGSNLIYDTDLNITWYDPPPVSRTWSDSMSWAAGLTVAGTIAGSWGLPTTPQAIFFTNAGEMGHLYYDELGNVASGPLSNKGPFTNLQAFNPDIGENAAYWYATDYTAGPPFYADHAYDFFFAVGEQNHVSKSNPFLYALAVHSGDIGASLPPPPPPPGGEVPEPCTMLLIGSGLLGLWGFRRKFKK